MCFSFLGTLRSIVKGVYFVIISSEINAIKHHFRYLVSIICYVKNNSDFIRMI